MRKGLQTDPVKQNLGLLWQDDATANRAAYQLYRLPHAMPLSLEQEQEWAVTTFLAVLHQSTPKMPKTLDRLWDSCVSAMVQTIYQAEKADDHLLSHIMVTLFPVTQMASAAFAHTLCHLLVLLYHKEALFLSPKPQVYWLEWTFKHALAAQHPQDLIPLWQLFELSDPIAHEAGHCALHWLREVHATAHLLFGLSYLHNHNLRMSLVNMLEEIAEPQALFALARLHRETAETDWPLSRRIARAVHIIAQQNTAPNPLSLLRPAAPPDPSADLLQPVPAGSDLWSYASRELPHLIVDPEVDQK